MVSDSSPHTLHRTVEPKTFDIKKIVATMNAFTIYGKMVTVSVGSYARLIALITLGILEP